MPHTTSSISSLTTDLFYDAVKNYIDYNKPDPIAKRQLEKWKLDWKNTDSQKIDVSIVSGANSFVDCPATNVIQGTLEIFGDYVAVTIKMECVWKDGKKKEDGRLSYQVDVVSAKFIERKNDDDEDEEEESKAERKIRKKMISRLSQDSYISKILALSSIKEKSNHDVLCLAQASIYVNTDKYELEERVDVSDTVAETLRRALWSSTKSPLDIVDVILALPSLPCHNSAANSSSTTTSSSTSTTRLANRAKLRLLEDAMLDECEKEGEDQLIDDLSISPEATTSPDKCKEEKEESTKSTNHKRKKKKSKK
ncbi:MAG: hypothetical protein ACI8RD_006346 [Bacillariaceae sp.]|jgi:hypothetical protein